MHPDVFCTANAEEMNTKGPMFSSAPILRLDEHVIIGKVEENVDMVDTI